MEIATGHTRRVFIFRYIVIKVARIYLYQTLKNKVRSIFFYSNLIKKIGRKEYFHRKNEIRAERIKSKQQDEKDRLEKEKSIQMKVPVIKRYEMYGTMALCLFGGIMANCQEWQFYRKTKNVFVMPTYFSFFGLFNIQKRGKKIDFWGEAGAWHYIHNNIENHQQPFCDGHTLASIENFCLDNGRLKIVDYGSRSLGPFLEINGEKLYNNFKIPD
jgi:hypothetical protein